MWNNALFEIFTRRNRPSPAEIIQLYSQLRTKESLPTAVSFSPDEGTSILKTVNQHTVRTNSEIIDNIFSEISIVRHALSLYISHHFFESGQRMVETLAYNKQLNGYGSCFCCDASVHLKEHNEKLRSADTLSQGWLNQTWMQAKKCLFLCKETSVMKNVSDYVNLRQDSRIFLRLKVVKQSWYLSANTLTSYI